MDWMGLLKTAGCAAASLLALFLLSKLMGCRQIAQMSFFDYVNGITIGSIAAELAVTGKEDFWPPFVAMVVYAVIVAAISASTNKSLALRKFLVGKPLILFEKGTLYERNLTAAKLDVNEFLTQARCAGYFDLDEVEAAILETNGQVSFLPKSANRPATPEDLDLAPEKAQLLINAVIDGQPMEDCLRSAGKDEAWLKKQLAAEGAKLEDVILATLDDQGAVTVYEKTEDAKHRDVFL